MRMLRAIAACLAATLVLAACGGAEDAPGEEGSTGEEATETTEGEGATETPDGSEGDVSLTYAFHYGWVEDSYFDTFREDHPNIEVELRQSEVEAHKDRIRTLLNTGDLPAVLGVPGGPDGQALVEAGGLMDLSSALDSAAYGGDATWRETFRPGLLEQAMSFIDEELRSEGQQWDVPAHVVSVAALYNKDLYDELGLSEPTTWEEFLSNNRVLRDNGSIPMSLVGEIWLDWWVKMAWDQTARDVSREDLESGEVSWTDPRLVEGIEIVQGLYEEEFFDPAGLSNGLEETQSLFISGELAHFVAVPGEIAKYVVDNAPFEVGAFPLPGAKDVSPVRSMGGAVDNIGIAATVENEEAAVELAKYLTSEAFFEGPVEKYIIPPIEMDMAGNPIVEAFGEAASGGFVDSQTWFQSLDPEAYATFKQEILPAAYRGEISAEEAMQRLADLFEEQ